MVYIMKYRLSRTHVSASRMSLFLTSPAPGGPVDHRAAPARLTVQVGEYNMYMDVKVMRMQSYRCEVGVRLQITHG